MHPKHHDYKHCRGEGPSILPAALRQAGSSSWDPGGPWAPAEGAGNGGGGGGRFLSHAGELDGAGPWPVAGSSCSSMSLAAPAPAPAQREGESGSWWGPQGGGAHPASPASAAALGRAPTASLSWREWRGLCPQPLSSWVRAGEGCGCCSGHRGGGCAEGPGWRAPFAVLLGNQDPYQDWGLRSWAFTSGSSSHPFICTRRSRHVCRS